MIIFDCNGVLVDSEPIATTVASDAFQTVGIDIAPEVVARYFTGRRPADMFADIEAATGLTLPPDFASIVAAETLKRFRQELQATPHAAHALTWLRGPKCVASSSNLERVQVSLEATNLLRFFDKNVFSASEVASGKPAPDLFRYAAACMGIQPRDCLVVEDSAAGITAAVAADMTAIGFVGGSHAMPNLGSQLTAAGASAVFADMRALKAVVFDLRGY